MEGNQMCGLVLDAVALIALVMALNQESESPGFGKAILAALGIALLTFVASLGINAAGLGLIGLIALIPLVAAVAGGILWIVFDVPPVKAALGGVIFLVYKVIFTVAFVMMFSSAR